MLIKFNHHLFGLSTFCGINIYIGQNRIIRMDMYNKSQYDSLYIETEPKIKRIWITLNSPYIEEYIFMEDESRHLLSSSNIMKKEDASRILDYFRNVLLLNDFEPEHC